MATAPQISVPRIVCKTGEILIVINVYEPIFAVCSLNSKIFNRY